MSRDVNPRWMYTGHDRDYGCLMMSNMGGCAVDMQGEEGHPRTSGECGEGKRKLSIVFDHARVEWTERSSSEVQTE